jgi:hypothetical protein
LPVLYLRGVPTGNFQEALTALLGKDAPNLSPAVITRLPAEWQMSGPHRRRHDRRHCDQDGTDRCRACHGLRAPPALTPAGEKVDRKALGRTTGSAIKLSADEDVSHGLVVGEGMETVLAGMRRDFQPAWALGGTSGIRAFPVLSGIESLVIHVDHDKNGAGQEAAQECMKRWTDAGREVFRIVPNNAGDDFNDVLLNWSSV